MIFDLLGGVAARGGGGGEHGVEGHDGFAGADVALQEAVHRFGAGEVFADGVDDAGLSVGEVEGEEGADALVDGVVDSEGDGGAAVSLVKAFDGDGGLVEEEFVVGEGALGGDGFFEILRAVDFFEGFAAGEEVALAEEGLGEPFGDLGDELVEGAGDDLGVEAGGEFGGGGVDGFDACGLGGFFRPPHFFVEDFEFGLDDLEAVAELGDFAGGADEHAGLEFFVEAEGVEPGEDASCAFVAGGISGGVLEEGFEAARLARDEAGLEEDAADGGHVAGLDVGDGGFVGVVDVVSWEVEEEVGAGFDIEGGEFGGADVADAFGVVDGGGEGEGELGHLWGILAEGMTNDEARMTNQIRMTND